MNGGTCSLFVDDGRSGLTVKVCYVVKKTGDGAHRYQEKRKVV